jgi:LysR family glycine cleavage system transcriptional activator
MAKKVRQPKDLLSQVLIRSDVKRVQWHQWFAANGLESPAIHGMRFDRSFLAIAMACGGVGVTLESTRLAEREIGSGRLVAPLSGRCTDIRYVGHHLVFPRAGRQRRALRTFVEWITSELADTNKET